MIKLYCCGPDYCSRCPLLYYFFQIRNGLGSSLCCKDSAKPCTKVWNNANLIYLISGFSILHLQTDNQLAKHCSCKNTQTALLINKSATGGGGGGLRPVASPLPPVVPTPTQSHEFGSQATYSHYKLHCTCINASHKLVITFQLLQEVTEVYICILFFGMHDRGRLCKHSRGKQLQ